MLNKRRGMMLNGEYGYDETEPMPWPFNVVSTHDIDDDEDEDDYLPCDPFIDYECDTETVEEDFDEPDKEFKHDPIDIFELRNKIEICEEIFKNITLTFYTLYDEYVKNTKQQSEYITIEQLIDNCSKDFKNLSVYLSNPGLYNGDVDMKHIVNTLMITGLTPNVTVLNDFVRKMSLYFNSETK